MTAPKTNVAGRPEAAVADPSVLDPGAVARLSRTARTVLDALVRLGSPYEGGLAQLVHATERPQRTVERGLSALVRAGIVSVTRSDRTTPALLTVHPDAAALAGLVERVPHRVRDRLAPRAGQLGNDSAAVRCAAVPGSDGKRFLPVAYVVDLMTERERAICAFAAASDAGPVCGDPALSNDLLAYFQRQVRKERFRSYWLTWAAMVREASMRDDVPAHIEDAA